MKRRPFLASIPWLAWAGGAAAAPSDDAPARAPGHTVSLRQLQQSLAERFPVRYQIAGLLDLTLQTPTLQLLPDRNRLGAALIAMASGPALGRSHAGVLELDFALRYLPADRTVRADRPRVQALRFSGLAADAAALLEGYGPTLAEQVLQQAVLHRLRPGDLALADAIGLQPDRITVTAEGLHIGLIAKPR